MIYIVLYAAAWIAGIVYYLADRKQSFVEGLTVAHLVVGIGLFGVWNFIGHTLMSQEVARSIGWAPSPFQTELGWASLGMGIAGFLCFWVRDGFWWATAIPFATFLLGAAWVHVGEIAAKGNLNPGNTWIILPDLLMPSTVLVLLTLCRRVRGREGGPGPVGKAVTPSAPQAGERHTDIHL